MRRGILAVAVLGAIGCSDATSPASTTAHHLDALYQQACALAGHLETGGYFVRCELLSLLIVGPASGVEPTPIQVITAGPTSSEWRGLVYAYHDTGGEFIGYPYNYVMIAYSDPNVTNAVVEEALPGSETSPYLVLSDTVLVPLGSGSGPSVDTMMVGPKCIDTPGLANPLGPNPPIEYSGSMCYIATFGVAMTADFSISGADSAFASVEIPTQNVGGLLVINGPWARYVRRKLLEIGLREPRGPIAQTAP